MNEEQQKLLNDMIQENDTKDNTGLIRNLKHSVNIRKEVAIIQNIKRKSHNNNFKSLDKEAQAQGCTFLFQHYPNIYNKLLKNEIQIKILYRFLDELESIEKGKQDQHEASYKIGMLLKEMYVDKRIDQEKEEKSNAPSKKVKSNITYEEYKRQIQK
tara:strand:- start:2431 stop:2901 length:471 start_codon:yes stop_codon:yes gene_type:complete